MISLSTFRPLFGLEWRLLGRASRGMANCRLAFLHTSRQLPTEATDRDSPPKQDEQPSPAPPPSLFHPPVYFDTHKTVVQLTRAGHAQPQAEEIVKTMNDILCSALQSMAASKLSRGDLDLLELRMKGDVESVRASVHLLEKSVVRGLMLENKALKDDIRKLSTDLKDEVVKVQSGVQLDLNLEKSRINELMTLLEQKVKDTNNRIGTEVAQIRTRIETQKLESVKYLAGGIFSIVTIILSVVLGLWRLMK